jgi:hypothetical protein
MLLLETELQITKYSLFLLLIYFLKLYSILYKFIQSIKNIEFYLQNYILLNINFKRTNAFIKEIAIDLIDDFDNEYLYNYFYSV